MNHCVCGYSATIFDSNTPTKKRLQFSLFVLTSDEWNSFLIALWCAPVRQPVNLYTRLFLNASAKASENVTKSNNVQHIFTYIQHFTWHFGGAHVVLAAQHDRAKNRIRECAFLLKTLCFIFCGCVI